MNKDVKDNNKALEELVNEMYENLEHYDTSTKTLIIKAKKEFDTIKQALTKEVSNANNIGLVKIMMDKYKDNTELFQELQQLHIQLGIKEALNKPTKSDNQFLDNFKRTGTKVICNEDGSVDVEEPTKSAKEMFEELGYELVKDRSFPNLVSYVKKTECYERIEICFNVPSKTYSKELNDKVWAITNEEHQAVTQQLKELEE